MLTCVRWYVAYPLSLRHIEEMMAERGILVDHATVHRWSLKILPALAKVFCRRQRPVGNSWRMDETYITVRGCWKYLYRAVDRDGAMVDFLITARRFLERAIKQHGEPEKITIDKSGTDAGFQILLMCTDPAGGHRDDARDPQGAAWPESTASAAEQFYSLAC